MWRVDLPHTSAFGGRILPELPTLAQEEGLSLARRIHNDSAIKRAGGVELGVISTQPRLEVK